MYLFFADIVNPEGEILRTLLVKSPVDRFEAVASTVQAHCDAEIDDYTVSVRPVEPEVVVEPMGYTVPFEIVDAGHGGRDWITATVKYMPGDRSEGFYYISIEYAGFTFIYSYVRHPDIPMRFSESKQGKEAAEAVAATMNAAEGLRQRRENGQ